MPGSEGGGGTGGPDTGGSLAGPDSYERRRIRPPNGPRRGPGVSVVVAGDRAQVVVDPVLGLEVLRRRRRRDGRGVAP